MFIDAMGLILADHKRIQLGELSRPRALAAMPFGGRYRIVDFMLSNMVNSEITRVGLITMNKYKSLMDHLGTGSSWDLDRKQPGLNILPPYITSENMGYGVEGDDLTGLIDYFRASSEKYVIVSNSNVIFNTTFNEIVAKHENSGADITVMYNRDGLLGGSPCVIMDMDRRGRVRDVMLNPEKTTFNRRSLGVVVIARDLLIDFISSQISHGEFEFSVELLLRQFDRMHVKGFEYKGLILRVNSIKSYFESTMRLLEEDVRQKLFWSGLPVYTKVKDEAPILYLDENNVSNSTISDGCRIMGAVENSMIFRSVTISRNAKVRNSIIFQNVHISEGCELENVIIDKDCVLRPGVKLIGQADYPVVIGKGAIV
ncbi:MAG: glucose-1-phosphate adenylyltransferase subunit GlgD [Saccharofermentanales bacterium]|jgi:glucose-1-phosphate adenylyltransferase